MTRFHQCDGYDRSASICMPTFRLFNKAAFYGGINEAQDVLVDIADVDLIYLEPKLGFQFRRDLQKRLLWRDFTDRACFYNAGLKPVSLDKKYELFIVFCQNFLDLLYVNAIKNWKNQCNKSICILDEVWVKLIPKYKHWLPLLSKFDHVIVMMKGSVDGVRGAIDRPCHYVPPAVDTLRFTPYPNPPERVIDVYSIGRRAEPVHNALRNMAAKKDIFYVHDTLASADSNMSDYREHRDLFADMAKRSRCFMVGPAKMVIKEDTFGQVEVGFRYLEGCASGAVLIGQSADCESFKEMFDWPDSVINVHDDGSDICQILSGLTSEPHKLLEISRRNAKEALLRHDWVYRWKKIFNIAGLSPHPAMGKREKRLKQIAEDI